MTDVWSELATKFQSLANATGGSQLRAFSGRNNESQDIIPWILDGAESDMLREQFKLLAAEAARARGVVLTGTSSLKLWFHHVYQFLVYEHRQFSMRQVVVSSADWEGTTVRVELPAIDNVCQASAAFCLSLQRQALEGELMRKTLAQRFQVWIVENSSAPELPYSNSLCTVQSWISSVAKCATTQIPIDFLSARLHVLRLPHQPSEFGSFSAFLDQVAREEGLTWCITDRGLWMAQQPPSAGVEYIDAYGRQHEAAKELAKPRKNAEKIRFNEFAGPLWKKLRQQRGRKKASIDDLLEIARQLDSERFLPPADYLEGMKGTKAVKRLTDYNSKNALIDTWVNLVQAARPSDVVAMRRTLSRSVKRSAKLNVRN